MSALTEMDAVKALVGCLAVVGLCAIVVTFRAIIRGRLRRAASAALVGAFAITVSAIGAVTLGLDALRELIN